LMEWGIREREGEKGKRKRKSGEREKVGRD
jgi:hypothetical protein